MSGRKRKTTTTVEELVPELVDQEPGPTELDYNLEEVLTTEKLREIVEQFPHAGITVKLYDDDGAFCIAMPDPTNIDEEVIRRRCGHGNFKLRIYVNGKYRQTIPLPIRQLHLDPSEARNGTHSETLQPGSHSDFLERQAQRNHELLLAAIGSARTTGPTLTEITGALANIDNLRGKQESALDMVLKGIELAKSMNGDTDWKSDLIRMGKDALPQIMNGVTAIMGNRNNGQQTQIPPVNATNSQDSALPSAEAIKSGIGYLKKKCLAGVNPDLLIEWVVTNADEYQGLIRVILNKEFSEFAQYDLEIGSEPFIGWFRALFDGLRSAFSGQDPVDDDTGRDLGDENHTGNDGEPRANGKPKSRSPEASA